MLKIILFAICIFANIETAFATDFLIDAKQVSSQGSSHTELLSTISKANWFMVLNTTSTSYHQLYFGPKFSPKDWLEFGVGAGAETIGGGWKTRAGGYIWAGQDKWSGIMAYENGNATGPWYKTIIKYKVLPEISVGLQNQKYQGHGIRAEWNIGKMTFWGTLLGKEVKTTQIGITASF